MKVSDIATCIEEIAPLSLQEDYDNAGWQVEISILKLRGHYYA